MEPVGDGSYTQRHHQPQPEVCESSVFPGTPTNKPSLGHYWAQVALALSPVPSLYQGGVGCESLVPYNGTY